MRRFILPFAAAALLAPAASVTAQSTSRVSDVIGRAPLFFLAGSKPTAVGTVTGRVTDKETGAPLAGAAVSVVGSTLGNNTDEDGRYRITGLSAGGHGLTGRRIGSAPLTPEG